MNGYILPYSRLESENLKTALASQPRGLNFGIQGTLSTGTAHEDTIFFPK